MASKANWIKISDHPSNSDASAELVSSSREPISIFRVKGGFVACVNGMALVGLYPSADAASSALNGQKSEAA